MVLPGFTVHSGQTEKVALTVAPSHTIASVVFPPSAPLRVIVHHQEQYKY